MDRPIIFIAIAFSLGIVFGKYFPFPFWLLSILLLIFFILAVIAYIKKLNLFPFILVLSLLAGAFSFQVRSLASSNDISAYTEKGYLTLIGTIDECPRVRGDEFSFLLKVEKVIRQQVSSEVGGTIYVFTPQGEELHYGDRIKVRGIISRPQSYSHFCLYASFYEKLPGRGGNFLKKAALWLSQKFNEVMLKILPEKEASLMGSILLGTSVSPLSFEVKDTYRRAGLIHLLVVSGTQVSILIGVCLGITRALNFPLWLSVLVTSFFNLMLVVVTGAGPSILRAAIMGEITILGLLFEREKEFYTSLALSAWMLLIMDPFNLFDIGFQLSFAATWALVYIAPVLESYFISSFLLIKHEAARRSIANLLAISFAPLLATSPIVAFNFNQISIGAVISNLLVLPWIEFLVILGVSTTLLGFILLPLAQLLGGTIWLMLFILDWIARFISSLPGACFYVKTPSLILVIGYYAGLIMLVSVLRKEGKLKFTLKRMFFSFLLIALLFLGDQVVSAKVYGSKELAVTFLDVGQGDCILVEMPKGEKILIDGGGRDGGENSRISEDQSEKIRVSENQKTRDLVGTKVVLPFLRRKGINQLDLVILTHPHEDHVGGLNEVLEEIKVNQVLDSGQIYESQAYKRFKALIEANKIKYSVGRGGRVIHFAENIVGYILNPFDPLLGDPNSDSVVMRLVYGDVSFLFTGDMERSGEERILRSSIYSLQSSVLKVGHHGSSTSTSDEFLKAVQPRIAVISVGEHNRYHHPHPSTLQKLKEAGVLVYRTDENGTVVIKTDGKELTVETERHKET